jgi:nucleotide-binding universal stress UspA family protein
VRDLFDRVLVPLDGSMLSRRILDFVRRLVARRPGEIILFRAVDEEANARAARDDLAELATQLGGKIRIEIRRGDPAAEILAAERSMAPTLIAMTTHGGSGIARWIRGSTAERVLREATVPLLLVNPFAPKSAEAVRPLEQELSFRRILVPLDGSARSASVLPLVRELAVLYDAHVCLFHVPAPGAPSPLGEVAPHLDRLEGVKSSVALGSGDAALAIVEAAAYQLVDLVVIGSHGRRGLDRWAFGSVAENVLRHVSAPLLVVRTRARPE